MRTRIRVWVTPEAFRGLAEAAEAAGVDRPAYLQGVIKSILRDHAPEVDADEMLPVAKCANHRYRASSSLALGYKGRWARWVQIQCSCRPALPLLLTRIAQETGDVSISTLVRRYLAAALESELGRSIPMPRPATGSIAEKVIQQ